MDSALETGKLYQGAGFKYIKESFETGTLHLIGLLSDGGVHSRLDQVVVGFQALGGCLVLIRFSPFEFVLF